MKGMVINLPPSGDVITPADMVRAIVSDINDWYRDAANTQLHYALKIGKHLIELKAKAKEAGQKWGDICEQLPFSQSTAVKLMSIAGNTALKNSEHVTNLPNDWGSIATLARLPAPKLKAELKNGNIAPGMNRAQINEVVSRHIPSKKKKASTEPETQPKAEPKGKRAERIEAIESAWKKAAPSERREWLNANREFIERLLKESAE